MKMCTRMMIPPAVLLVILAITSCGFAGIGEKDDGGGGSGSVDLVLNSVVVNGSSPVESFTLNMHNAGSAAASGFETHMAFCVYPFGDPVECYIVYEFTGLSLEADQSAGITVQWADVDLTGVPIPNDFAVSAYVDATGIIQEPDEDNNFAFWSGTLFIHN